MQSVLRAFETVDDPTQCPVCQKRLRTAQGLSAHLKSARSCQWYKKGKLKELTLPGVGENVEEIVMEEVDAGSSFQLGPSATEEDPGDVAEDIYDSLFDFVPLEYPQSQAGPSTRVSPQPLDAEEMDERVEVEYEGAGWVIRMDETVHEKWRQSFGGPDTEGDVLMEESSQAGNKFSPFASQLDWQVAKWAVQEGIGHKSLDRLLGIPGVSGVSNCYLIPDTTIYQVKEHLGLSYHNTRGLHQILEEVPNHAAWHSTHLWFRSDPQAKHLIHYRDPLEAIRTLLGNPAYAKDIVYRPRRIFTNPRKEKRIYHEMWTGNWWYGIQVSFYCLHRY